MAAMGIGRVVDVAQRECNASNERLNFAGRKMVRPVGRRLFMQASGLIAASTVCGCEDESDNYILAAVAVAVADIAGVYLIGVPVGTLVAGAVTTVKAADSGRSTPDDIDVRYDAPSSQGVGTVTHHDYSGMPRTSDRKGKVSMDAQGKGWVQTQNTTDESIEYVKLIADNGAEILPTNKGLSGFLDDNWEAGDDLYLTGVPENYNYSRLFFQTTTGKQGYINLT